MLTSVLIIDDSSTMRKALRTLLENTSQWQVCGEADNGETGVAMAKKLNPDVIILDFEMPIMNGIQAAKLIATEFPQTPMLMVTMHSTRSIHVCAKSAGVTRVISKCERFPQTLLSSLSEISKPYAA